MNLMEQLVKVLDSKSELFGTIVSLDSDNAVVATNRGTVYCSINIQTQLEVGNKVRIRSGMVVGLLRESSSKSKVYTV